MSRVGPTAKVTAQQTEVSKPPVKAPALTREHAMPIPVASEQAVNEIPLAKDRNEEAPEPPKKAKKKARG